MNKSFSLVLSITKIFCALAFLAVCSCEDDADTGDVSSYFDDNPYSASVERATTSPISISPATQTIDNDGDMQTFKANGGTAPYTWSVQNSSLGSIISTDDNIAVYQRIAYGDNTLVLQDSNGDTAFAVISQPYSTENDLAISPTYASVTNNNDFATFTASGGLPPYTWDVETATGKIVSSGGKNATYQRKSAGDNVVKLQDSANDMAYALISQP